MTPMNLIPQNTTTPIKRWRWWSDWQDICLFSFSGYGYLLQGRVNRINGKSFRCIPLQSWRNAAHASVGDLIQRVKEMGD